jgi:hypothetical protein
MPQLQWTRWGVSRSVSRRVTSVDLDFESDFDFDASCRNLWGMGDMRNNYTTHLSISTGPFKGVMRIDNLSEHSWSTVLPLSTALPENSRRSNLNLG